MMIRTYTELCRYKTFEERFFYLELKGVLGLQTFGFDRWMNQLFYKSLEWKSIKNEVIIRDDGCDLGIPGYEIPSRLIVHHMNPMSVKDLGQAADKILDPEFLITTSIRTHNAIHYGDEGQLPRGPIVRTSGDTTLW